MKYAVISFFSLFLFFSCNVLKDDKGKKADTEKNEPSETDLSALTGSEILLKYQEGSITLDELVSAIAPKLLEDKKLYEEVVNAVTENKGLLEKLKGKDAESLNTDYDGDGFLNFTELLAGSNLNDRASVPVDANKDKIPDVLQIRGEKGDTGLQGLSGEKGDKGDKGDTGNNGVDGLDGLDGEDGIAGQDGLSIVWKGSLETAPENPEINWAYYNTITGASYIYSFGGWEILASGGRGGKSLSIVSVPAETADQSASYIYQPQIITSGERTCFYFLLTAPSEMVINKSSGLITWETNEGMRGKIYDVMLIVSDDSGNNATQAFTITVFDTTPPSIGTISIADNSGYTNDSTPDLSIYSSGASFMRFALSEAGLSSSEWVAYASSHSSFDISAGGDGPKTIWVEFKDQDGNIQAVHAFDSTIYGSAPPSTGSISITDISGYTNDDTPELVINSEGASHMRFALSEGGLSSANWVSYATSYSLFDISPGGDGLKTIWVEFKSIAGNIQPVHAHASTTRDRTAPEVHLTSYPPSDGFVYTDSVTYEFSSEDPLAIFYCSFDWGIFEVCASPKTYSSFAEGTHIFQAYAKDLLGNSGIMIPQYPFHFDIHPPVPGTQLTYETYYSQIKFHWDAASDNLDTASNLLYKLVKDDVSITNIDTVSEADTKTGTDLLVDWSTNITDYLVSNLTPETTYHFALLVKDDAGNKALYNPVTIKTTKIMFVKTYGDLNRVYPVSIQKTSDNGFMVFGGTNSFGAGNYDGLIFKTDNSGIVLWQKAYRSSENDYFENVFKTKDGGFFVFGAKEYGTELNIWIIKFDSFGSLLWQKKISPGYLIYNISETEDAGFIIATSIVKENKTDSLIFKLDSYGSLKWQKIFDISDRDSITSVCETSEGGFLIVGSSYSNFDYQTLNNWIFKLDSSGSVLWQKNYNANYQFGLYSICKTTDGGFIFVGNIQNPNGNTSNVKSGIILKLDSTGTVVWQKTFGGSADDRLFKIQKSADGNFLAIGYVNSFGAGDQDCWIIKLDSSGTVLWQMTYGTSGQDWLNLNQLLTDGSYLFSGSTRPNGSQKYYSWLMKLSSSGNVIWQKSYGSQDTYQFGGYPLLETADSGYITLGSAFSNGTGNIAILKIDENGMLANSNFGVDTNAVLADSNSIITNPGITFTDFSVTGTDSGVELMDTNATIMDTNLTVETIYPIP